MRLWNVTQLWKLWCHFINLSKMYIIIYLSKHCLFENYSILLDLPTQAYESLKYCAIGKFHNCQPNQPTLPWVKQSESRVKTRPEQRQAKEDVLKNLCTVAGSYQKIFFKIWLTHNRNFNEKLVYIFCFLYERGPRCMKSFYLFWNLENILKFAKK